MAPAPTQPGQAPPPLWVNLVPILLIGVVFWFALIRPQQKKAKEHEQLLKSLRKGDRIITNGGIIGTVISVKDKSVSLRSEDTKLEVLKSAVSEVIERASNSESQS